MIIKISILLVIVEFESRGDRLNFYSSLYIPARQCPPVAYRVTFPRAYGRSKARPSEAISGSKLNSQLSKVIFPHFARKLKIAATFYRLHEYNKLNLQWNKRNAIYFTVEFHAGTRRNSLDFNNSGGRITLLMS